MTATMGSAANRAEEVEMEASHRENGESDKPEPLKYTRADACTLFEGDYHYGVGALANSLYNNGFRGVLWAGYRGALPPWAQPLVAGNGYQEFSVGEGCVIRFVPQDAKVHFTNHKPQFMLNLWESFCPEATALLYFDPDITVRCNWTFLSRWAHRGIALCEDVYLHNMSPDHPVRLEWRDFLKEAGYTLSRPGVRYFNGGFVGVARPYRDAIAVWRDIIQRASKYGTADLSKLHAKDRTNPFNLPDQDSLNIMTMVTPHPLSTVGPEGMDFTPSGFLMSHAAGGTKPWRKRYLASALDGKAPTPADRGFWANVDTPIALYPAAVRRKKRREMRLAAAIGRFIQRR